MNIYALQKFNKMTTKIKTNTLTQTVLADGRIELSGPTFDVREAIKAAAVAAGGKAVWDGARKVWIVPAGTVVPAPAPAPKKPAVKPREATGSAGGKASTSKKSREEWTREEWQTWSSAYRRRNRGCVQECCIHADDISEMYGPSHYICERHGETKGDYTGD